MYAAQCLNYYQTLGYVAIGVLATDFGIWERMAPSFDSLWGNIYRSVDICCLQNLSVNT